MSKEPTEQQMRNRADQARLYGAPLGDLVDNVTAAFGLTRGRLAEVLGVSAPMLSQLATGQRVKLGNPLAVQRLQGLLELLPDVKAGTTTAQRALAAVEATEGGQVLTRTSSTSRTPEADAGAARRALLSAASGPEELRAAAELLQVEHPALAKLLRDSAGS